MNKKDQMYTDIKRHGESLLALFPNAKEQDPIKLCKALRRLEAKGSKLALDNCNIGIPYEKYFPAQERILASVRKLLGIDDAMANEVGLFMNGDPRGYALKLDDSFVRVYNRAAENPIHTDWGGYGIIAPDFSR